MADMQKYFDLLRDELQRTYSVASEARAKGLDPEPEVEVKIAKDVAARVESIVGPKGVAEVIRAMEKSGMSREDIAFELAKKIANGEVIQGSPEKLVEQAVRTGLGILTEGVLVAPTEGIGKVNIRNNPDGSNYVSIYYSGPIRSAGGTAVALSVLLADIARRILKIGDYRVTDTQVERYVEEINVYEARVAHLQYKPPEEDVRLIVKNCPICVDGEPTEEMEVSAFRNVPGVETNRIRGGIPLVICEGIAQKAAKVHKYTKKLKLGWDWLEKIIKVKKTEEKVVLKIDDTYLDGLVAGRPVFSYPSRKGGFRLRYGKSKTNGLMAKNVHPVAMEVLDKFLAYGTHMKIERPGKGCIVSGYKEMEPPVVKLSDGSVVRIETLEKANEIKDSIKEVLFLGDMLVNYGDFVKANSPLLPSAWCEEWFAKECEAKAVPIPEQLDAKRAFEFSKTHSAPLHPRYTFNWSDINKEQLKQLAAWLKTAKMDVEGETIRQMILENSPEKSILEELLIEHKVADGRIHISGEDAYAIFSTLGMPSEDSRIEEAFASSEDVLAILERLSGIKIMAKAPTYIGARMGRPEKAKERKMDGSPNVLFPTGSMKNRSITKLYKVLKGGEKKTQMLELANYRCTNCNAQSCYGTCSICKSPAKKESYCRVCEKSVNIKVHCDRETVAYSRRPVEMVTMFEEAKKKFDFLANDEVKGVKGLSNVGRIPERLEKGFLRAKHGAYVFRDGTSRFDATNSPLTHFTPKEVGASVEKLKALGYEYDYYGKPLENEGQLLSLYPQDIVISEAGADYFTKIANFMDDCLINVYGVKSFYNIRGRGDLIGKLCAGLSPHTSAAVLCRIIGFTKACVGYAHPYFHSAKRRNCDSDEDSLMLLMDPLINFSFHYLTEKRGGTMDAPLVLTPYLDPKEVDDEAHCIEIVTSYPLEFYYATLKLASPNEVKIKSVKDVLGKPEQFDMHLTHAGGSIDEGNLRTTYVQFETMSEKIASQFKLQEKLRAVDKKNAAERLILSHFVPDLYGNLRSFSRQTFRCGNCNTIFRRIPLMGKCNKCGGNILLTINKGGIEKYLEISRSMISQYALPDYLKQRMELIEKEIKSIFEDEKNRQLGLADFV